MEKLLTECCTLMIRLLDKLLEQGSITEEEYSKHIALKKKFLEEYEKKPST